MADGLSTIDSLLSIFGSKYLVPERKKKLPPAEEGVMPCTNCVERFVRAENTGPSHSVVHGIRRLKTHWWRW